MELRWNDAAQGGGCFIVDATRRGKRFPDSLSKTIPIWACVLNRAVYQHQYLEGKEAKGVESSSTGIQEWDCSLHLPLWISESEHASIERRIDEWVKSLNATGADLDTLAELLKKPLRPLWISQRTVIWLNEVPDSHSWDFTPLILLSASQPVPYTRRLSDGDVGWSYIPGAADDEESWARGLSPDLFWKYAVSLINCSAGDCNRMVADIVEQERVRRGYKGLEADQIRLRSLNEAKAENEKHTALCKQVQTDNNTSPDGPLISLHGSQHYHGKNDTTREQPSDFHWVGKTGLAVASMSCVRSGDVFELVDCAINCGVPSSLLSTTGSSNYLYLQCVSSKHDRFSLQNNFSRAVGFAREKLRQGFTILIFCVDGEDLSISVCLAILLAMFDRSGLFDGCNFTKAGVSKLDVRQRLVYLCNFATNARPSRGSLRQVYNFLSNS